MGDFLFVISVYILYSQKLDKYYVGQSENFLARLDQHNMHLFATGYTVIADDWELFFQIQCKSRKQAVGVEKHIKRMKSRNYLANLATYPEIVENLLIKYQ